MSWTPPPIGTQLHSAVLLLFFSLNKLSASDTPFSVILSLICSICVCMCACMCCCCCCPYMPIIQHELFQVKHCNRLLPLLPRVLPFLWHSFWLLHSLRRCCLNQPITLHESHLTRWLSAADSTSGSTQYLPPIKLIMHRDGDCISTRNGCMLKLNQTAKERAEGVSETWQERRQQGGGKKTYNAQASSTAAAQFWNPPSSCDFLPLLHSAAETMHMRTHLQAHTPGTLCARTCSIRQGLCVSKKVTLEACGGRDRASQKGMAEFSSLSLFVVDVPWKLSACMENRVLPFVSVRSSFCFLGVKQNKVNRFPPPPPPPSRGGVVLGG